MKINELTDERFFGVYLNDFFLRNKRKFFFIFLFSLILGFFTFKKQANQFLWNGEVLVVMKKLLYKYPENEQIRDFEIKQFSSSEVLLPVYQKFKEDLFDEPIKADRKVSYSDWISRITFNKSNQSDLILGYIGSTKKEVKFVLEDIIKNYKNIEETKRYEQLDDINKYSQESKTILEAKLIDSEYKLIQLNSSRKNEFSEANELEIIKLKVDIDQYSKELDDIKNSYLKNQFFRNLYSSSVLKINEPNFNEINQIKDSRYISILTFSFFILFLFGFLMIVQDRLKDALFLKDEIDILLPYKYLFTLTLKNTKDIQNQKDILTRFLMNSKKNYQIFYLGKKNKLFVEELCSNFLKQSEIKKELFKSELDDLDPKREVILFLGSSEIRRSEINFFKDYFDLFGISIYGWIFLQN